MRKGAKPHDDEIDITPNLRAACYDGTRGTTYPVQHENTTMPWWAILYLGLFGLLAVGGLQNDMENRRPAWFLACAVVSGTAIMYLFAAHWLPWLRAPETAVASAYVAAMSWELYQLYDDVRRISHDPDMSLALQYATSGFVIVFSLPMFIVAGISAFGG